MVTTVAGRPGSVTSEHKLGRSVTPADLITSNEYMSDLENIHALVTGAGSGIGKQIVRTLSNAGACVSLMGRTHTPLASVAQSLEHKSQIAVADVTDRPGVAEAVERLVDQHGPIEILVNNAGGAVSESFAGGESDCWDEMINVNLNGIFIIQYFYCLNNSWF